MAYKFTDEDKGIVKLTTEQHNILKLNADKFHALEAAGVSEWSGYEPAMDKFYDKQQEIVNAAVVEQNRADGYDENGNRDQ